MKDIWKFIIALLISKVIGNLTYRNLDLFKYQTDDVPYSFVNIAKLFLNFSVSIGVALLIFWLMKKVFEKKIE
ncbi:hypothetical protein [Paenibacillus sp. GCM10028914]|uniref:hypothetical protein n=1 Tax=Paenibacillus sp. GCM10028914 TaxID=3273416 RepID=UPI0036214BB2